MLKKTSTLLTVLLGILFSQSVLMAQKVKPTPAATPARKPISMKWGVFGGMNYYHAGVRITDDKSLEAIINPLGNAKASQLLKDSENSEGTGVFLLVGGTVLMVGGLVTNGVDTTPTNNGNTLDTQQAVGLSVALAGVVVDLIGAFKVDDARTEKFAAVQQYNAIVHGEELPPMNFRQPTVKTELLTFKF